MKGLYITNEDKMNPDSVGVIKKINAQINGFERNDVFVDFAWRENNKAYHIEKKGEIFDTLTLENGLSFGWRKKVYEFLLNRIKIEKYDFLYIRKFNVDFDFINFLKKTKSMGLCIVIELPTYPYFAELEGYFKKAKSLMKLKILFRIIAEKTNVKRLKKYVDYITTYSTDEKIFDVPCINIINGMDFEATPERTRFNADDSTVNMIAVSTMHQWHGFDRLIEGFNDYYKTEYKEKVFLYLVGNGPEMERYKNLIEKYNLTDYIEVCGTKLGKDLSDLFEKSDIAINTLGMHRINVFLASTLKTREYAAYGLPIVSSPLIDAFPFDENDFVFKVPEDESNVDVTEILKSYKALMKKYSDKETLALHIRQVAEEKTDIANVIKPIVNCIRSKDERIR